MAKRKREEDREESSRHKSSKKIRIEGSQLRAGKTISLPQNQPNSLVNSGPSQEPLNQAKVSKKERKESSHHKGPDTPEHVLKEGDATADGDTTKDNQPSKKLESEKPKNGRKRKRERERKQAADTKSQKQKVANNGSIARDEQAKPGQHPETSRPRKSKKRSREKEIAKHGSGPKERHEKNKLQNSSDGALATTPKLLSETSMPKKVKRQQHSRSGKKHSAHRQAQEGNTKDSHLFRNYGPSTEIAHQREYVPSWTISEPVGGQMLNLDPVYSKNEEYLLLANKDSVRVYATATSLLVRKLSVGGSERVSTFSISTAQPDHLWLGTEAGVIQRWDWLEGHRVHSWDTKTPIHALAASKPKDADEASELIHSIRYNGAGSWTLDAHRLNTGVEQDRSEAVTLRKSQEPITAFKVLEYGRIIIAISGSVLTLGVMDHSEQSRLHDLSYIWRDIECPEWISCFDVRLVTSDARSAAPKSDNILGLPRLDIVVGGLKGSLHVYDDLLNQLIGRETDSTKNQPANLNSRTKHWHRNAVLSAKWSRDGNYIISGGLETVLLIWQLETGSLNMLPHLGAPVDRIVVSPTGADYAIRLADNSAMILSTAELKPTFSVAGIQIPLDNSSKHQLPYVPNIDAPIGKRKPRTQFHQQVVNGPSGLLCAVPSATSSRIPSFLPKHASYLQTFDLRSASQISKQALTRTKATDLNVGPESNTIQEPNVILMQLSHNGQWLATVDEWMPPPRDLAPFTHDHERTLEAQITRRETYLKFWSWNNDTKIWELVSRIDDPHASQSGVADGRNKVLNLASSPSSNAFATIGDDGIVQVWKPSYRHRHGQPVKLKDGKRAVNWHCHSSASLDLATTSSSQTTDINAQLAYSADGSCLAAAYASSSLPWTIHLIDPKSGTVRTGPYGPFTGPVFGLGIIDQYLICLSDHLRVWNLITQQLVYAYTLTLPNKQHTAGSQQQPFMAVDALRGTFAVALPEPTAKSAASRVVIFEAPDPTPVFNCALGVLTTLTTLNDRAGYIIVDSAAEIRILTPTASMALENTGIALPTPPGTPTPTPSRRGLDGIFGNPTKSLVQAEDTADLTDRLLVGNHGKPVLDDTERNARVVPAQKLAEAFETTGHVMPSVGELFERVAMLYAGR
ncbi:MAG: hypothetical protein Q9222_005801 [Ikaeria aurantiellina]